MFQSVHKKEAARTRTAVPKPKTPMAWKYHSLSLGPEDCEPLGPEDCEPLGSEDCEPSGPEDCEPSVEPEDFGKGGVEVESEYDLKLRIGGNVGRPGMGHSSLLTVPNKAVRW
jgi:hypothetical protein